jgi:hypothetical protein
MRFRCADVEEALRSADAQALAAASAHAAECPGCRGRLRAWDDLSRAAQGLRRQWESPGLWTRIEEGLKAEAGRPGATTWTRQGRTWPAAAAVMAALAGAGLFFRALRPPEVVIGPAPEQERLLTEETLSRIERAEAEYARTIEELEKRMEPQLEAPGSPLLLSYREKLFLLDSAIAECRAQIERNRFNAHLRRELLSVYQEKKRTLELVAKGEADAL